MGYRSEIDFHLEGDSALLTASLRIELVSRRQVEKEELRVCVKTGDGEQKEEGQKDEENLRRKR